MCPSDLHATSAQTGQGHELHARNSLCGPTDSGAIDQNTGHPMRFFGSLDTFRDRFGSETSTRAKKAPIAAARSWPDCSFRSKIGTFKLLSANSHAVASPKPDAPPVTIAPLPVKSCTKRSPWFRFLPNVPRLFFSAFCYVSKQFYSLAKRRDAFPNCAAMRRTYHGR